MIVRLVAPSDFDAIAALTNHNILRTAIHFGTAAVSGEELRTEWAKTRDRYAFVVAEVDGEVAGFAKVSMFRTRAAYSWTGEVGIYVDERHHRKGIASALYTRLIDVSRAQGFHVLVACITVPNPPSVNLHERLGFELVGTFPEIGFKLGQYHDVGFWCLRFSASSKAPEPLRSPEAVW